MCIKLIIINDTFTRSSNSIIIIETKLILEVRNTFSEYEIVET